MNIIVTLTTIPTRLNSKYKFDMRFCLESLLNQNYDNFEVHLNIPNTFKKTGEDYIIPDWLNEMIKNNNKLKLFRTEDYGSATKLIPTIQRTSNGDIIIVVDDDIIYHEELVNEHLKNIEKWPNYVIGYDGMRSRDLDGNFSNHFGDGRDYYYTALKRDALVDIIQHYKSVVYRREFFEDDFSEFWDENGTWCDDKSVSAYFSMKKRGRLITYFDGDPEFNSHPEWLAGIRHTFPVLKHTEHETHEGCNLERADNNEEKNKKINDLYKYIDNSYQGKKWTI